MADLKLGKLPNRTPVKLTLSIMPDVEDALGDYVAIYNARNFAEASPADLGAAIIRAATSGLAWTIHSCPRPFRERCSRTRKAPTHSWCGRDRRRTKTRTGYIARR